MSESQYRFHRLPEFDYSTPGAYFITVCTNGKRNYFWESVAALTAQPLAALPPYGCGVPLAGSERLWQLQVSRHFRRAYRLSSLSLRGGRRPTRQSRSTRLHRGKATGEIATAFPRLPRRFAPRNDTSGGCSGNNGASYQIGAIDCRFAGVAVPAPTLICETARSEISIHEQNKL